jgi:hypothetical protein
VQRSRDAAAIEFDDQRCRTNDERNLCRYDWLKVTCNLTEKLLEGTFFKDRLFSAAKRQEVPDAPEKCTCLTEYPLLER